MAKVSSILPHTAVGLVQVGCCNLCLSQKLYRIKDIFTGLEASFCAYPFPRRGVLLISHWSLNRRVCSEDLPATWPHFRQNLITVQAVMHYASILTALKAIHCINGLRVLMGLLCPSDSQRPMAPWQQSQRDFHTTSTSYTDLEHVRSTSYL